MKTKVVQHDNYHDDYHNDNHDYRDDYNEAVLVANGWMYTSL